MNGQQSHNFVKGPSLGTTKVNGPRKRSQHPSPEVVQGPQNKNGASPSQTNKTQSRISNKIFIYLVSFILFQILLASVFLFYHKESFFPSGETSPVNSQSAFKPPCQVKAKEAISALKRASSHECKQELAEVACKGESDELYPRILPNLCPGLTEQKSDNSGKYLGCFKDDFDTRLLPGTFQKFADNSRPKCINFCFGSGYQYAGTQFGKECFCGNGKPTEEFIIEESECNKPCTGDKSDKCGGYLAMNVFETGYVLPKEVSDSIQSNDPVRIVYLLSVTGRSVRQVKRLIKRLFNNRNYFYIHVDARQDYMHREMQSLAQKFPQFVRLSKNRFSTIWGGASLLKMLVSCMSDLLIMEDWKWDFVINLSESDYPLKSSETLVDFLTGHREKNFVKSHGREAQIFISKQGLDQTFHECDNHMFRIGPRQLPQGITVDGGSDWVCLNKKFVNYVVSGSDDLLDGLRVLFNYTLLPAESFFHTTLKNSKFCSTYVNNNLRMTNWKRHLGCKCQHKAIVDWCGCSPNDFLPDDWPKLNLSRKKDIFFGRKFEPIVNQGVLDMVDNELLEIESGQDTSYWQNIYHHLDRSPKPDPAVVTLGQVLSESAIDVVGLNFEELLEVTSLHYDDIFEGIVLTFTAKDSEDYLEGDSKRFEAFVRLKQFESKIEYRDGEIAVGTDFDPKELIFRNEFLAIGPMSKPVLTYDFDESSSKVNASARVLWRNPVGKIVHVNKITILNTSFVKEFVELKDANPLLPGMWSAIFIVEENSATKKTTTSKVPFLVTPLLPVNSELSDLNHLKRLHRGKPVVTSFKSLSETDLSVFEETFETELFIAQAERNAEKTGPELREWIRDLSSSFFAVESVCSVSEHSDNLEPKFAMLPKCFETEWSTHYPDDKSNTDEI